MKTVALIVAGGIGIRLERKIPKQFLLIDNLPVLMHTINKFSHLNKVVLVIPKNYFEYWNALCKKHNFTTCHKLVEGGGNRFLSVKNGLDNINDCDVVAIHDGVRPIVSKQLINDAIKLININTGVIPILPVINTIRQIKNNLSKNLERKTLFYVQTPQCFKYEEILNAYKQPYSNLFTDDASVFEANGGKITTLKGEGGNIKITKPEDLKIAGLFLRT
jgi:2-C-methyl-D-erythritol 4-phosphate cytidylyltransferase